MKRLWKVKFILVVVGICIFMFGISVYAEDKEDILSDNKSENIQREFGLLGDTVSSNIARLNAKTFLAQNNELNIGKDNQDSVDFAKVVKE